MKIADIPDYATRDFVPSRVAKPLEFAGAVQLVRRDATTRAVVAAFTAVVQNRSVATLRTTLDLTTTEDTPSPRSWTSTKHDNVETAIDQFKTHILSMLDRGYEPIVDGIYVVPMNATDVKAAARNEEIQHWILSIVYNNFRNVRQHVLALADAASDPSLPPVPPTATSFTAAPPVGSAPRPGSSKTKAGSDDLLDLLSKSISGAHGKALDI